MAITQRVPLVVPLHTIETLPSQHSRASPFHSQPQARLLQAASQSQEPSSRLPTVSLSLVYYDRQSYPPSCCYTSLQSPPLPLRLVRLPTQNRHGGSVFWRTARVERHTALNKVNTMRAIHKAGIPPSRVISYSKHLTRSGRPYAFS